MFFNVTSVESFAMGSSNEWVAYSQMIHLHRQANMIMNLIYEIEIWGVEKNRNTPLAYHCLRTYEVTVWGAMSPHG